MNENMFINPYVLLLLPLPERLNNNMSLIMLMLSFNYLAV